ncbi:hypothetical protein RJT34_17036 [Clitoria ternatea]|uniref:Uncharacterized protein n=1 Tax=Clitoria ternatea TaxID=43366 RepID=A0AAN9PCV8_CLITE
MRSVNLEPGEKGPNVRKLPLRGGLGLDPKRVRLLLSLEQKSSSKVLTQVRWRKGRQRRRATKGRDCGGGDGGWSFRRGRGGEEVLEGGIAVDEGGNMESGAFDEAYSDRSAIIDTTHTFEFLSLDDSPNGIWNASNFGDGVIMGMIDSGI